MGRMQWGVPTSTLSTYAVCIVATCLLGWWLWRSWRGIDDEP